MRSRIARIGLVCVALVLAAGTSWGREFVAFSLRAAQQEIESNGSKTEALSCLGGMTVLAGMVRDPVQRDWILVGEKVAGQPPITLDDLVVAVRAVFRHNATPQVSIDPPGPDQQGGDYVVRFKGGIEDTMLGKDMLDADVLLKRLALGKVQAELWGLRSYVALRAGQAAERGVEDRIASRFWFKNLKPSLAIREDVFAIMDLAVGVETEVLYAEVNGKQASNLKEVRDEVGDLFASNVAMSLDELCVQYPVLRRARPILGLVSIAEGMRELQGGAELSFWMEQYDVERVSTPLTFDPIKVEQKVDGRDLELSMTGGLQANPIIVRLKRGYPTAFRQAVLDSRPSPTTLIWHPPLDGWHVPGVDDVEAGEGATAAREGEPSGFSVDGAVMKSGAVKPAGLSSEMPPFQAAVPQFTMKDSMPARTVSDRVGGVMLRGAAKVAEGREVEVDFGSGDFSLVVDGENARLAPEEFRRFVTALWSVYYSEQGPGISIDPIAPGAKKHLVRYIGKVVNNDLGRVMREADYLMKKWAVGTERPNVVGFADVDALSAKHGLGYVGAHRRFWFVPEDMTFKQGGDLLLFDSGRMTVKTEYVIQNRGRKAEPADEAFAGFFTQQYGAIAAKYPVYQELFDYAKLVSLAKYLKERGVPLFWFLMANKDLVLTEDSPGTVDAIVRGSKAFEGITIEGGVDLAAEGRYVYDAQAVQSIQDAAARFAASDRGATSLGAVPCNAQGNTPGPLTFALEDRHYSVLPQHSLTSGKDRRGIRYQTDLALRAKGQPGLELVRYFKPGDAAEGEFGRGWRLLVPYRVKPAGEATQPFLNAIIPTQMTVVNLVTGEEEVLTFSKDRYSIAGYVPDRLASSQVIGLFLMTNASYRLADKLGNEFWFDGAGFLTDMLFSEDAPIHFEYLEGLTKDFARVPYEVKPDGGDTVPFQGTRISKRMRILDAAYNLNETLVFSDGGRIVGYVPEDPDKSRFKILALLTDGSFRLLDRRGSETQFSASGTFEGMAAVREDHPIVASISQGDAKVVFKYTTDREGNVMIAEATLSQDKDGKTLVAAIDYQYDDEGRLSRVQRPNLHVARAADPAVRRFEVAGR